MSDLLLGVFNKSAGTIVMNPPTHLVGLELMPVLPAPITANSAASGLFTSDGTNAIEVTYNATIAPGVTLFIDIWVRGTTFEKLIVTSTDPVNYPIEGKYVLEDDGAFICSLTVG